MKVPVYWIWYDMIVGETKTHHTFALHFSGIKKKAETVDEMKIVYNSAHGHLFTSHGGEGRTIIITGMEYLSMQEPPKEEQSKSKNDVRKANTSKPITRKSGAKR